jgi:DNA-binding response OmpR family regulator
MAGERGRILVVDDDDGLRELLVRYLSENGYEATGVPDGAAMKRHLATEHVDLLLLDVMLPGEDGLTLARALSAQGAPPIIMLSARGEEIDRIVGLEVGADDYLPKPFSHRELLARVAAVLRRRGAAPATGRLRRFGPFEVDLESRRLTRNGEEIEISGA